MFIRLVSFVPSFFTPFSFFLIFLLYCLSLSDPFRILFLSLTSSFHDYFTCRSTSLSFLSHLFLLPSFGPSYLLCVPPFDHYLYKVHFPINCYYLMQSESQCVSRAYTSVNMRKWKAAWRNHKDTRTHCVTRLTSHEEEGKKYVTVRTEHQTWECDCVCDSVRVWVLQIWKFWCRS